MLLTVPLPLALISIPLALISIPLSVEYVCQIPLPYRYAIVGNTDLIRRLNVLVHQSFQVLERPFSTKHGI